MIRLYCVLLLGISASHLCAHVMLAGSVEQSTRTLIVKPTTIHLEHDVVLQEDSSWLNNDPTADANSDGMIDDHERTTLAIALGRHIREGTNLIWNGQLLSGTTETLQIQPGEGRFHMGWALTLTHDSQTTSGDLIWVDYSFAPTRVDQSPTLISVQGWNATDENGRTINLDGTLSGSIVIRLRMLLIHTNEKRSSKSSEVAF